MREVALPGRNRLPRKFQITTRPIPPLSDDTDLHAVAISRISELQPALHQHKKGGFTCICIFVDTVSPGLVCKHILLCATPTYNSNIT